MCRLAIETELILSKLTGVVEQSGPPGLETSPSLFVFVEIKTLLFCGAHSQSNAKGDERQEGLLQIVEDQAALLDADRD